MADVTDVQEYEQKYQNQLAKLEAAEIDEDDKDAVRSFIRHLDMQTNLSKGTLVSRLNHLRLCAEEGEKPLTSMKEDDIDDLLFIVKHERNLAPSTLRNYRKSLRKFFLYRGEDWAEDIKIGASPNRKVDPNDLLTRDEIDSILEAAKLPRDKAAVALLADTGIRIGALASLRIKDFDSSEPYATISINEEANVKGASGSVPVTWSRGYVANWLDIHPRRDDPDAPIVHKLGNYYDGSDDGALTYQYLSRRIREIGREAGIDEDRLNTHNFRKSAISRWIREGLTDQVIKHRAFWKKDSSQFEVYSGVTDEELNGQIAAHYDMVDKTPSERPSLAQCPQCRTPLRDEARFCPGCGTPLTQGAAQTLEETEDDIVDSIYQGDQAAAAKILEFRELLKSNTEVRKLLLEE